MENDVSCLVPGVQVKPNTSGVILILERDDLPAIAPPRIALVGGGQIEPFVAATVVGADEAFDRMVGGVPDAETVFNVWLGEGVRI